MPPFGMYPLPQLPQLQQLQQLQQLPQLAQHPAGMLAAAQAAAAAATTVMPPPLTSHHLQPRPSPYGYQPILYWYPSPPVSPQSAYYVPACPTTVVVKGLPFSAQTAEILAFFDDIYEVRDDEETCANIGEWRNCAYGNCNFLFGPIVCTKLFGRFEI